MQAYQISTILFLLVGTAIYAVCDELDAVIAIYRHGDRTIVEPYPADPYKNISYWPVGFGQLTNIGKQQHYELGKWLRNRYGDFLSEKYSERDIYVRSTDVDRTLMSAYSNLAGLYEPHGSQIWNPQIDWQPIPVHTQPEKNDAVLAMKKSCPKYNALLSELLHSNEFVNIDKEYRDLYDYLTEKTGKVINNIENTEYIYNTLFIEELYNFTLPEWTRQVYPERMRNLASLSFAVSCYTRDMARLKVGPLMNEFIEHFYNASRATVEQPRYKKFYMYSAHDTTVANVLNAMHLFEYHSPPYTSTVIFELKHTDDALHYVNIFYKNSTEARMLQLPGCDFNCPLEQFIMLLQEVTITPERWEEECELGIINFLSFSTLQQIVVIGSSVIFLMLIFSILLYILCSKSQKSQQMYLRLPDSEI